MIRHNLKSSRVVGYGISQEGPASPRLLKSKIEKRLLAVGPEYLALTLTLVISGTTGGTWAANKILNRFTERAKQIEILINTQERKLENLEEKVNRLPLDYVLKVDFLREIKEMHDNFKQINMKLDKLVEKLLSK